VLRAPAIGAIDLELEAQSHCSVLAQFSSGPNPSSWALAIGAIDLELYLPRELLVLSFTAAGNGLASTLNPKP